MPLFAVVHPSRQQAFSLSNVLGAKKTFANIQLQVLFGRSDRRVLKWEQEHSQKKMLASWISSTVNIIYSIYIYMYVRVCACSLCIHNIQYTSVIRFYMREPQAWQSGLMNKTMQHNK